MQHGQRGGNQWLHVAAPLRGHALGQFIDRRVDEIRTGDLEPIAASNLHGGGDGRNNRRDDRATVTV